MSSLTQRAPEYPGNVVLSGRFLSGATLSHLPTEERLRAIDHRWQHFGDVDVTDFNWLCELARREAERRVGHPIEIPVTNCCVSVSVPRS